METIEKPKSAISASSVHKLCPADKSKTKTAQSYVLELAMRELGIYNNATTAEMRHGIDNQTVAYEVAVLPKYSKAVWYDKFIAIDNRCGASPDVLIGDIPLDVKCPYTIPSFFENINNVSKAYIYQLQMQMLATKGKEAVLCVYCTKPKEYGVEWNEHHIELERRIKFIEFKADTAIQDEIMQQVDVWHPKKIELVDRLKNAEELSLERYFFDSEIGIKYNTLSESSNVFNINKIYKFERKFYYQLNK
jgi:hypothetical protein